MNKEKKTISELIRYYRVYVKHMTQEEFATEYCGVATRTLQTWESGEKLPSIKSLRLAFKDNMDMLDEAIELREQALIDQEIVADENEFLLDIFKLNENIKDNARRWTSINNVIPANNIGPVKVLGDNFMVPVDEKGNMITRNGKHNGNTLVVGGVVGRDNKERYILPNIINNLGKKNFIWADCDYTYDKLQILMPGYDIVYLSSKEESDSYNPFNYITCQKDIIDLADSFCDTNVRINSNEQKIGMGDPYFSIAQENLLYALFTYVYTAVPKNEQSLEVLYSIYKSFKNLSDVKDFVTELKKADPENSALGYFKVFLNSSPKTVERVFMSIDTMFNFCSSTNMLNKINNSTFNIEDIFTKDNQAVIISHDFIDNIKPVANMLILQLIKCGYYIQDKTDINNKIVDIYFDEFGSNYYGFLPYCMATSRNHKMNIHILIFSLEQCDAIYDNFGAIAANCATKVIMSVADYSDAEAICEQYSKKSSESLIDPGDLLAMRSDDQLVFIMTYEPIKIKKAEIDDELFRKLL